MRAIVHLDADAFFASVEQAADPRLRCRPVAVGGEKRGIIASASYEARQFGIYTPMPTVLARRLCPKLIVLPGDFEKYERFSRWMFSYAYDFTPEVEISSIDEGYFDLTGARRRPMDIAGTIRRAIRESLKISVSEGLGSNKLVSQIASKLHKPAAFIEVPGGGEKGFLQPLPNEWLPGVGPKCAARLNAAGLALIGQVAATPVELLELLVGGQAAGLRRFANGVDDRPLVPAREPAKSYSHQETFAADTTDEDYLEAVLRRMADRLMAAVRADHKSIRTVTVKVRYNDLAEDQAGESLDEPTDLETDLYGRLRPLLRRAWQRRVSLRLVALKFSSLYEGVFRLELPLETSSGQPEARRRLARVVDQLRVAHGPRIILRGHDFILSAVEPGAAPPPAVSARLLAPGSAPQAERTERFAIRRPPPRRPALYAPLHVHSYYSFLDSTLSIESLVQLAARFEVPALALTDAGNLHGAVEFYQAARKAGLKPIIGAEIQAPGGPVRLLVQEKAGYANLCRILSRLDSARPEGEPEEAGGETGKPPARAGGGSPVPGGRTEAVLESGLTGGLIAISPSPRLARLFPGRFYLEAGAPDDLRRRPTAAPWPLAACPPIHYGLPGDREKFLMVQSIRTRTLLRQEHPGKQLAGEFHFPAPAELCASFKEHPQWLASTLEIAGRCDFEMPLGPPQFPACRPPDGSPPRVFLRRLVLDGLRRRYPRGQAGILPQIEEELAIIGAVGYEEYFLVVWEILQECRRRGIEWITRGSAADSLVCYCLGISGVCPIRFDLYFRRFLNPERMQLNKLPDIDVDFPHDRKDEVIDLIFGKYGTRNAAVVGGFSTYQARSAVADVAKVLGVSEHQIRRFTGQFPHFASARGIGQTVGRNQECQELPLAEEPYRTALEMAEFLDGFPRHPKMHPCGVVLSRQPMDELTPTFVAHKGYPTTHFDMDAVEAIGLVKMDILAQGGLAVMRDVKQMLADRRIELDLGRLATGPPAARREEAGEEFFPAASGGGEPWQDPRVWELIAGGGARAVHHIESPAMIGLCRQCNVREIDGLVAIVSVIRPGAANEQKKLRFTRRYQGLEPVTYPDPLLEPCLKSTFGLVVYEEHVLQMCEVFAGLSTGRADVLRRALSKRRQSVIDGIRDEFYAAARQHGRPEERIGEVWDLVSGFAGYAFCKAHSTAYAVEAYQSAWLKYYFPAEFMAAVLTNGKGFYHPLVYVLECQRLGIPLLPPCVNQPGPGFRVVPGGGQPVPRPEGIPPPVPPLPTVPAGTGIRVPATRVKGLTARTTERLLAARTRGEFQSLTDFYRRVGPLPEEMEALLRVGALDCFAASRTALFWEFQFLQRAYGHGLEPDQGWLLPPPCLDRLPEVPRQEPTRRQRLEWESELLDFPASGHPLELYGQIAWDTYCPVARLGQFIGQTVVTCGLVIEQRLHQQITGEPMKFLTLADWTGIVETELFADTYRSYGLATVRYPVLEVTATIEPYENGRGFSLRVLRAGKPRTRDKSGPP